MRIDRFANSPMSPFIVDGINSVASVMRDELGNWVIHIRKQLYMCIYRAKTCEMWVVFWSTGNKKEFSCMRTDDYPF